MRKSIFNLLPVIFLLVFAFGCNSKYPGFDKSSTGMYYKMFKISKDTAKPVTGDWVSLDMKYTSKIKGKDTVFFNSKEQMKGEPIRFLLPPSDFKGDLYEGIRMMSAGDSAIFVISADSLFEKTFKQPRPSMIDSNSVLYFHVHLISSDSRETMLKNERDALQKYLTDNKVTVPATASGIYIIPVNPGKGMKIDSGCMVKLQFTVSTIDGKQIFSSYDRPEPIKFQYGKRFDTPGLEEAISTMQKDGEATIIVPSEMAFGERGRGSIVPPYATLVYSVKIVDVQSKADYEKEEAATKKAEENKKQKAKNEESNLRSKYLKDNNITVKPTADGLYFIEKAKGTGAQAAPGKKLKVHYTGTLLSGKKFESSRDNNQPYEFTLGRGEVIRGWDEGFAMMKQGGKATLIVPSSLAYGDRENGVIPAYSTLVFDVELMEVTDAAPPKKPGQK